MLSIKPVPYVVADVNLIDDLVGVLLQGRREDHNLVVACHCLNELNTARSHEEEAVVLILERTQMETVNKNKGKVTYLNIVDQCLIQIKHQSVNTLLLFRQ